MSAFDYMGIIFPYSQIGKNIDELDYKLRLPQNKKFNVQPLELHSTIQFNSTYIELVDKVYHERGYFTIFGLWFVFTPILILIFLFVKAYIVELSEIGFGLINLLYFIVMIGMFIPVLYLTYRLSLKIDTFTYTHFPIRFNRKNKMVYVFAKDGIVSKYHWDDLYVAIMVSKEFKNKPRKNTYDVRLNVLDENKVITHAFALPYCQESYLDEEKLMYKGLWEYVRRYMEEGVKDSYAQVEQLIPIAHQRETLWLSIKMAWHSFNRYDYVIFKKNQEGIYINDHEEQRKLKVIAPTIQGLFFSFVMMYIIGRYTIAKLAKRPIWPDWVEAECQIDANDVYDLENHPKPKKSAPRPSLLQWVIYLIAAALAYLNLYVTAWLFDLIGMAKDVDIGLHRFMEFWNWFG